MKIIDTFSTIPNCFVDDVFNMGQWEKYCNLISPELPIKLKSDIVDYNFSNDVLPILNAVPQNYHKLNIAHRSFLSLTDELSNKIRNILQTELNISIIFYLGLCNGAGWATELDGIPVVLLGVEKIIELSWHNPFDMAGLLYHELGHIWHDQMRSKIRNGFKSTSLWQLYREGIAMYIEQLLMENESFYHQDKDGWLNWCQANEKELCKAYLTRLNRNESTCDFFGDWNRYEGKSDTGYYLGCEIIKDLSKKHSLKELANLEENDVYEQLRYMVRGNGNDDDRNFKSE